MRVLDIQLRCSGKGEICPKIAAFRETITTTEQEPRPSVPIQAVSEKMIPLKPFISTALASLCRTAARKRLS
jgi:hypothetical protein